MKNSFGSSVILTLFGESHGAGIGAVLDGLAPGITVDEDFIRRQLSLRRPVGDISTPRAEPDNFVIESGVFGGKTTGTPICIVIPNVNTRSKDYSELRSKARPGHADYAAYTKYHGFEDYRGGGHFSGRITAGIVAAGAIAISALKNKGIYIGTHIKSIAGVADREFRNIADDIKALSQKEFASALFSVPAVKGVEFGAGFALANMRGSAANDEFFCADGKITTATNNNGGINGGITNGMPVVFRCAVKPTPTIHKEQNTVDFIKNENVKITAGGRHDPCIVHRARVVIDSITAIALCDMLAGRFGTDWLGE